MKTAATRTAITKTTITMVRSLERFFLGGGVAVPSGSACVGDEEGGAPPEDEEGSGDDVLATAFPQ
jgi:hypothetical protein